jgi:2,3-bisphosphoglycerate-independent phosphoglycerate mutase
VVWQDIVRIDVSIKKRQFHKNQAILESCKRAKEGTGRLHLLGLVGQKNSVVFYGIGSYKNLQVSDGGVHSHIDHLFALLETAKEQGVPHTYVHFLGDGRDTAPRSSNKYAQQLLDFIKKLGYGEVATVIGRYYAMDRDKRWERIKIAVDGLVQGEGEKVEGGQEGLVKAIEANYEKDVTDEFLKPIIVNGDEGRIKGRSFQEPYSCV